jgi:hypothetical protein
VVRCIVVRRRITRRRTLAAEFAELGEHLAQSVVDGRTRDARQCALSQVAERTTMRAEY